MTPHELIPTRHSLLRRMKDWQDQTSWEEFFNTYRQLIHGVAIKAGLTEAEAQEVVQETLLTVARKINQFKIGAEHGSFKGWLLQITGWRIADQFRKRQATNQNPSAEPDGTSHTATIERVPDPASLNLEAVWDQDWKKHLAEAALAGLRRQVDPEQYQMFDLHVLKRWPAVKVATKLQVKMSQVYFAKYKLSRLLRKEIKRLERRFG